MMAVVDFQNSKMTKETAKHNVYARVKCQKTNPIHNRNEFIQMVDCDAIVNCASDTCVRFVRLGFFHRLSFAFGYVTDSNVVFGMLLFLFFILV